MPDHVHWDSNLVASASSGQELQDEAMSEQPQLPGSLPSSEEESGTNAAVAASRSPRSSIVSKPKGEPHGILHPQPSFSYQQPLKDDSDTPPGSPKNPPLTRPSLSATPSTNMLGVGSASHRRSSLAGTPGMLRTDGPWWTDSTGRTLMLRGVNVSGSAKLPFTPKMPSHVSEGFFDDVNVSFVGRPFPLDEADEHFARLRRWGFNFLRFNVAWEALEHGGPGIYDYEYMDYVVDLLKKAKHYGLRVFIDPHQDVWSRFSGGSGAPGWTLRMAGLDAEKFKETAAAIVHNTYDDRENYPKMIWPTNYAKLACATMFTLFFGGRTFAPQCLAPDGSNIQDFLQNHYFAAFAELAKRIALAASEFALEDEVVIGYDTLNEPHAGFIGIPDLNIIPVTQDLRIGLMPTPFQGMMLGSGIRCDSVEVWELSWAGPRKKAVTPFDPKGVSCWSSKSSDGACIWAKHGVWDPKTRKLLKPAYFTTDPATGRPVEFLEDFWRPFVHKFTTAIRAVHQTAVIFIEPPVNEHPPRWDAKLGDPTWRIAYAPHWYDGLTLINKAFNRLFTVDVIGMKRGKYLAPPFALKFGDTGIRACFRAQLNQLRKEGLEFLGQYPCIMGEIGIPYDMDDRKAYRTGNYADQEHALDINCAALETNLINFTLWNYCSDNSNKWGDGWNGEDLSIFSKLDLSPEDIVKITAIGERGRAAKMTVSKRKEKKARKDEAVEVVQDDPPRSALNGGEELVVPLSYPYGRKWSSTGTDESREQSPARSTEPLVSSSGDKGLGQNGSSDGAIGDVPDVVVIEEEDEDLADEEAGDDRVKLRKIHRARSDGSIPHSTVSVASTISSSAAAAIAEQRLTADEDHLDVGGRALRSFARPYPVLTPGTPLHLSFYMNTSVFTYTFSHPADPSLPLGGAGGTQAKRRKGFRHQYRRLYLMPHLHTLSRPSTASLSNRGGENTDTPPSSPPPPISRRRSILSMTPSTRGEYTLPTTTHTSMDPRLLSTEVEIYLPRAHYPDPVRDMEVWVSDGKFRVEPADMRLHWRCGCFDGEGRLVGSGDVEHTIVMRRRKEGLEPLGEFGRRRRREVEVELDGDGAVGGVEGDKAESKACPGCDIM
ncbi:hypothetical protein HDU67_007604 [Dinochytrium kinnereticum]|nr:hypothetical protein HDU67_007604 [Dinochytrium kinnereticum]